MPWSIFSDGGGDGAALTWAKELLAADHAPDTPATEQFIYDWEKSEGGGGKYNPLNQGPVPGHSELTTTGEQYGGGAADYASYSAGIQGAVDFLNMPNYAAVQKALQNGDASGARAALIQSPWAESHYGWGASFSNAPLPGQTSSLLGDSGVNVSNAANVTPAGVFSGWDSLIPSWLKGLFKDVAPSQLSNTDIVAGLKNQLVRGSLILFGAVILLIGLIKFTNTGQTIVSFIPGVGAAAKSGKGGKSHAADAER